MHNNNNNNLKSCVNDFIDELNSVENEYSGHVGFLIVQQQIKPVLYFKKS